MKRIEKGTPGYLDYKKKVEIIRTVIYFLLVAAIFTLGYVQTKTRSNLPVSYTHLTLLTIA